VFGYYLFIIIILLLSVLPNIYDLLLLGFMVVILITPLMDVMLWIGYCCYVVYVLFIQNMLDLSF